MTIADIHHLSARGEGPSIEFKTRTPEPARLAKEVIAFANTRGGKLLIGVEDDGTIKGVKDSAEEEYSINLALEQHCDPPVRLYCRRVPLTRKRDVIVLSVPRSRIKPHFLTGVNGKDKKTAYVRVEDMSIEASEESLRLMISESTEDDVQFEFGEAELKLMRYLEQYGRISVEQLARLTDLTRSDAVHVLVTLTTARVLVHHREFAGDYFMLRYNGEN